MWTLTGVVAVVDVFVVGGGFLLVRVLLVVVDRLELLSMSSLLRPLLSFILVNTAVAAASLLLLASFDSS